MAITKKETRELWDIITNAQHAAWLEGFAMGEDGGEKKRNPYPITGDVNDFMKLYRLLKGEANA